MTQTAPSVDANTLWPNAVAFRISSLNTKRSSSIAPALPPVSLVFEVVSRSPSNGLLTMVAMALHVAISAAGVVASMATRGETAALIRCTSTTALPPTLVLVTTLTLSRSVPSRRRKRTPYALSCKPTALSLTSLELSRLPAPTSSTLSRLSAPPAPPKEQS
jgi:hypothetical protein